MKRMIALLAAMMILALCGSAMAENAAAELYEQAAELLFHTDNVTLKVKADFSLEGEWFKTLDGTWMQDRDRSFRQVLLTSPKTDGTELHNGYTIVTSGYWYNVMEVYSPGTYRTGTTAERESILHRTVESEQLLAMGSVAAENAELLLGDGAVVKGTDGTFTVALDQNAPAMVNIMLNQLIRFGVKRWFDIDYDTVNMDTTPSVWYYTTLTEGLLYSMRNVALNNIKATVSTDENGGLKQAEGTISLNVETVTDGVLQLDIRFEAEVSDRGSTMVRKFNPDDYGVVPAEDNLPASMTEGLPSEEVDELIEKATEAWQRTGYAIGEPRGTGFYTEDNFYVVVIDLESGCTLRTLFDEERIIRVMDIDPVSWDGHLVDDSEFDPVVDPEEDAKIKEMLLQFMQEIDPLRAEPVKDLKIERRYEVNGSVFADYNEYPLDQEGDGVLFVVRLDPEPVIEYYATYSNG